MNDIGNYYPSHQHLAGLGDEYTGGVLQHVKQPAHKAYLREGGIRCAETFLLVFLVEGLGVVDGPIVGSGNDKTRFFFRVAGVDVIEGGGAFLARLLYSVTFELGD